MMGKRAHVSFIRVLFAVLITICVAVGCVGIGAFRGIIDNAPDVNDVDISPLGYATFLYDGDGNQLRKLTAPSSNRLPVSIDQIPTDLQHAVVAIEDERFYEHNGIDVRGILRAFVKNITSGDLSEGASTITQQLLKNNVFTNWTNESTWLERFTRKIQEQYLAVEIEKKINDKNVILENYLNTINLADENDVLIAISKSGITKTVIQGAELAKEKGLKVIAITEYGNSKLGELADHVLLSKGDSSRFDYYKNYNHLSETAVIEALLELVKNVDKIVEKRADQLEFMLSEAKL